jgi:hypothetical protein
MRAAERLSATRPPCPFAARRPSSHPSRGGLCAHAHPREESRPEQHDELLRARQPHREAGERRLDVVLIYAVLVDPQQRDSLLRPLEGLAPSRQRLVLESGVVRPAASERRARAGGEGKERRGRERRGKRGAVRAERRASATAEQGASIAAVRDCTCAK